MFVRLADNAVLQLFNDRNDTDPFQELPLQACYSVSDVGQCSPPTGTQTRPYRYIQPVGCLLYCFTELTCLHSALWSRCYAGQSILPNRQTEMKLSVDSLIRENKPVV